MIFLQHLDVEPKGPGGRASNVMRNRFYSMKHNTIYECAQSAL